MVNWKVSLLLIVPSAVTLWFFVSASTQLWNYTRLTQRTPIQDVRWEVVKKSSNDWRLQARYSYAVAENVYEGVALLTSPAHLNHYAAEKEKSLFEKKHWQAWYAPGHPSFSSLEKMFPYKELAYGVMSLGVFLYFFWITRAKPRKETL